ncbi:MAG: YqgE/AlgH family protein [Sediminibacterium sp.]|jgi:putative transcriptional regulator|nr:YqgE/AlgH family protein [Sediminibacterium sp.]
MEKLQPGTLLLSDPFLQDPNFARSVVLLCEHNSEGAVGFVISKSSTFNMVDLLPEEFENRPFPVYEGGPVQPETIHFIHRIPQLIPDGVEIIPGLFWGGNFEVLTQGIHDKIILTEDVRIFSGYSGWSEGQLEEEIKEKSWISRAATIDLIFKEPIEQMWPLALRELGGEYAMMPLYPIHPQLN